MGALVQSGLFGIAGYHYFDLGPWGAVAGAGVGLVVNFSIATASSKISDIAKNRKTLAYLSFAILCIISPVVINTSLGWSWATAAWSVAVDLSIVLTGAIIGKGLVQSEQTTTQSVARPKKSKKTADPSEQIPAPVAQVQAIPAQSVAPAAKYPRECGINGCTYVIKNAQSVGGHMKAQHKAALGIFEPIPAEKKQ
jgi:hypothetical protein